MMPTCSTQGLRHSKQSTEVRTHRPYKPCTFHQEGLQVPAKYPFVTRPCCFPTVPPWSGTLRFCRGEELHQAAAGPGAGSGFRVTQQAVPRNLPFGKNLKATGPGRGRSCTWSRFSDALGNEAGVYPPLQNAADLPYPQMGLTGDTASVWTIESRGHDWGVPSCAVTGVCLNRGMSGAEGDKQRGQARTGFCLQPRREPPPWTP